MAAAWAQVLEPVIPEPELEAVYLRAARDHRGNFPLTHADLLNAWDKLQAARPKPAAPCQYCAWRRQTDGLPACPVHGLAVGYERRSLDWRTALAAPPEKSDRSNPGGPVRRN